MLSDWHFLNCIHSGPDRSVLYLQVVALIDDRGEDEERIEIALGELCRMDSWLRIHALPRIALLAAREPKRRARGEVIKFFERLVGSFPDNNDLRDGFRDLTHLLMSRTPPTDWVAKLRRYSDLLQNLPSRPAAEAPYTDLADFLPESFCLSFLRAAVILDPSLLRIIEDMGSETERNSLRILLHRGAAGKFGRLPYLLSVSILGRLRMDSSLDDAAFLAPLRENLCRPQPEADMIEAAMEWLAASGELKATGEDLDPAHQHSPRGNGSAAGLLREAATLRTFFRWRREGWRLLTRRASRTEPSTATAVVLWQLAAWRLAAEADPAFTATSLSEFWVPPKSIETPVEIGGPEDQTLLTEWRDSLSLLAAMTRGRLEILLPKNSEAPVLQPLHAASKCFSPWLELARGTPADQGAGLRYYNDRSIPVLLRLLAGCSLAAKLLRDLASAPETKELCSPFLALVAHGYDVLRSLRVPMAPIGPERVDTQHTVVESSLLAFAIFVHRSSRLLGSGIDKRFTPRNCLDTLSTFQHQLENEGVLSRDERRFATQVLPSVLVSWVVEAFPHSTQEDGFGLWLELVPELFQRVLKPDRLQSREARLMLRFLRPEHASGMGVYADWRESNSWAISRRDLLLTPKLPARDWHRPSWSDPMPEDAALVRSLERVAVLHDAEGLDKEVEKSWALDWKNRLARAHHPIEMDRFVKRRLLELLESSALSRDPVGHELISLQLLEFGGPSDLSLLLARLLPEEASSWLHPGRGIKKDLQPALLQPVAAQLARLRAEERRRQFPQEPELTLWHGRKVRVLENGLRRACFFHASVQDPAGRRAFQEVLTRIASASSLSSAPGRRILEVSRTDDEQSVEGGGANIQDASNGWTILSASFDTTLDKYRLLVNDVDAAGCTDLLEADGASVKGLLRTKGSTFLVGAVSSVRPGSNGSQNLSIKVAAGLTLESTDASGSLRVGEVVRVPAIFDEQLSRVTVSSDTPVMKLQFKRRGPLLARMRLRLLRGSTSRRFELSDEAGQLLLPPSAGRAPASVWDLDLWQPDISSHFANENAPAGPLTEMHCIAWLDEMRGWRPPSVRMFELLRRLGQHNLAVLCLVEHDHRGVWTFSLESGLTCRLAPEDFHRSDADRLRAEVLRHPDPRGLLVAMAAVQSKGAIKLALAQSPDQSGGQAQLEFPFDTRNLRWRELFRGDSVLLAHFKGNQWTVEAPMVPGFLRAVQVSWTGAPPPPSQGQGAEFSPLRWHARTARVEGAYLQSYQLRVQAGPTRHEFTKRMLSLDRSRGIVRLDRVTGWRPAEGRVTCRVREGFLVTVDAESLSMAPLPARTPEELKLDRDAAITRAWWTRSLTFELSQEQVPRSLMAAGQGEGVLARFPAGSSPTTRRVEVWWLLEKTVESSQVELVVSEKFLPMVGSRVRLERLNERWALRIDALQVSAQALWQLESGDPLPGSLLLLGHAELAGEKLFIAQRKPGKLVALSRMPRDWRHLSHGEALAFEGGLLPDDEVARPASSAAREKSPFVRTTLSKSDGFLSGSCPTNSPSGTVCVASVRMRMEPRDSLIALRRTFYLTQSEDGSAAEPPSQSEHEELARWQEEVERSGQVLQASVDIDRGRATVVDPNGPRTSTGKRITPSYALVEGERPLVPSIRYSKGRVCIVEGTASGSYAASFRRVPAVSTLELWRELGSPELGVPYPLARDSLLVAKSDEKQGKELLRFEWGYGYVLEAEVRQLRFQGAPFNQSGQLLFLGDRITSVRFARGEPLDRQPPIAPLASAVDDDTVLVDEPDSDFEVIIDVLFVQLSTETSIFLQRSRHHIVHLLQLQEDSDGGLRIQSVFGLGQDDLASTQRFSSERATLDQASSERLRERWPKGSLGDSTEPRFVLGRLDEDLFKVSLGEDVVFRHVRLSFEQSEGEEPLQSGELVFVKGTSIEAVRNDLRLNLSAWNGIADEDVGRDCRSLRIHRRNFSVREDKLGVVLEAHGAQAEEIQGGMLVRVTRDDEKRVKCLLWWSTRESAKLSWHGARRAVPARSERALEAAVVDGPTLAVLAHPQRGEADLVLEMRPGIFVHVHKRSIASSPNDLEQGDILSVESSLPGEYALKRAGYSERRYIPVGGRAAVVLPMNPLFLQANRTEAEENSRHGRVSGREVAFSVGGLPGITALPGEWSQKSSGWRPADSEAFLALMTRPHPKIAGIGFDVNSSGFRVDPALAISVPGRLSLRGLTGVTFLPLDSRAPPVGLNWLGLTFADEPILEIERRLSRESWRYHDSETVTWPEKGRIQLSATLEHSAERGPLFFEMRNGLPALRYSTERLPEFGFPMRELVSSLRRQGGGPALYAVAACSSDGGLWAELAPGRVVEIPSTLMVAGRLPGRPSLEFMNWPAFEAGDRVLLSLPQSDALDVDQISLDDWIAGPRAAFGSRSYLPIVRIDPKVGATTLGSGDFQLQLPFLYGSAESVVQFEPSNSLGTPAPGAPEIGFSVLLGVTEGLPVVLGWPGWRLVADGRPGSAWESDPLREHVFPANADVETRQRRLASVVLAAGGALPVTIELVSTEKRILLFSLRSQRGVADLPPGRLSLARVAGVLPDGKTAFLRCGGGLLCASLVSLVRGLPRALSQGAGEALRRLRTPVWIRREGEESEIRSGFSSLRFGETSVRVVAALRGDQSSENSGSGLICQTIESSALCWLPSDLASWSDLSPSEIERCFPPDTELRVLVRDDGSASRVGLKEFEEEFRSISLGSELVTEIVAYRDDQKASQGAYLARTIGGLLVACESSSIPSLVPGTRLRCEVAARRSPRKDVRRLMVVPLGKRTYTLDLPRTWLLDGSPSLLPRAGSIERCTIWRQEAPPRPWPTREQPGDLPLQDLQRWLCQAFGLGLPAVPEEAALQVRIASEIVRRLGPETEVELPFALMALLLLHSNGKGAASKMSRDRQTGDSLGRGYCHKACMLARDLATRALRSGHVEVLARDVLKKRKSLHEPVGFGARFAKVEERLRSSIGLDDLRVLELFCEAVRMRSSLAGYRHWSASADAIRRCLGWTEVRYDFFWQRASICRSLVETYRHFPLASDSREPESLELSRSQVRGYADILESVLSTEVDLVLLPPLPEEARRRSVLSPELEGEAVDFLATEA